MTDPYRDSARVRGCPICAAPWDVSDPVPTICSHDCGVWMTIGYLAEPLEHQRRVAACAISWRRAPSTKWRRGS